MGGGRGLVDGHAFYFRERHGFWQIELDLQPSGHFANRLVEVGDDGDRVTSRGNREPACVQAPGSSAGGGRDPRRVIHDYI